jgi:hypothetical protein
LSETGRALLFDLFGAIGIDFQLFFNLVHENRSKRHLKHICRRVRNFLRKPKEGQLRLICLWRVQQLPQSAELAR